MPPAQPSAAQHRSKGRTGMRLSRTYQSRLLASMQSLLDVRSVDQFTTWTRGPLQELLPHGMSACGVAEIGPNNIVIRKAVTDGWPQAYFEVLQTPEGGFYSPIMARWNADPSKPQLYEPGGDNEITHQRWREAFHDFGLRNIAAHGVHDVAGSLTSYFNFSAAPDPLTDRTAGLIEILTPHMHLALTRVLADVQPFTANADEPAIHLTARERDVLHWMVEGKTNWEIAQIAGRSEHTIKHQVEHVLVKLGATNRAQAVAKALGLGIVR